MSETIVRQTPAAFLASFHSDLRFRKQVLSAFRRQPAVVEVTFQEFVRGAGGADQYASAANPAGSWWVLRRDLERIQFAVQEAPPRSGGEPERRDLLRRAIRDATAVSVNWNSYSRFWGLTVLGEPLRGLKGPAAAQPVWSGNASPPQERLGNANQRELPGGVTQYFFPKIPSERVRYFGASRGRTF